jgi:hypothetical protein
MAVWGEHAECLVGSQEPLRPLSFRSHHVRFTLNRIRARELAR